MAIDHAIQHRAEELAGGLPPLLVAAERVASTVAQGVHGRRRVGQGDSFWQFRPYAAGDAIHRIDWRETAKSDRAFVRETEWEAAQSVWLWNDRSASMDYHSSRNLPTKGERAGLLLLALVALLVRGGERAALLGSGLPPSTGRAVLNRIALMLMRQSSAGAAQGGGRQGDDSLPVVMPLPRHGSLVLIGDFLSPLDEVRSIVAGFAASGVRGHLLQVLDPVEETLPFDGRVRFEGLENEPPMLVSRVESLRSAYLDRLAGHRDGLAALARTSGWSFATHRTDRPPHTALLALYGVLSGEPAPTQAPALSSTMA